MPIYVAQNIARIPTVPIEDIEIFVMSQKLENLDSRMKKIEVDKFYSCSVNKNTNLASRFASSKDFGTTSGSMDGDTGSVMVDNGSGGEVKEDINADGAWSTVARKGEKKVKVLQKVVGCNKIQASKLKPVKQLQKKFIFLLDNVTVDLSCADVESYISDSNVSVINYFEAKSWIHFSKDSQVSCHAFRICIKLEDKNKVFDSAFWPEGVLVREWKFKSNRENDR